MSALFPLATEGHAQAEVGRPYLTNYLASDYNAHFANIQATQDARGVLYVANSDGLLEYDGVNWRLIRDGGHIRSLGRDQEGRVWVGGRSLFGYVAPDSLGRTTIVSLLDHVPPSQRNFSFVTSTIPTPEGIYFSTWNGLFRYRPDPEDPSRGTMDAWEMDTQRTVGYWVNEQLYLWQVSARQLLLLVDDEILPVTDEGPYSENHAFAILPYDESRVLVGRWGTGLFLYDGTAFTPFETEADSILSTRYIETGISLPGGRYAIGTQLGGLVIIDDAGKLLHHLDTSSGLQNNLVQGLYYDDAGSLWALMDKAITRIDIDSPFTHFDAHLGISDISLRTHRHRGQLYVGTSSKLVRYDHRSRRFTRVDGVPRSVRSFVSVGDELAMATVNGLYVLRGDRVVDQLTAGHLGFAEVLQQSPTDSSVVFFGSQTGLWIVRRTADGWTEEGQVPGMEVTVEMMIAQSDGTLWVRTEGDLVHRVRFPPGQPVRPELAYVESFGAERGMPEAGAALYLVDDRPFFTSAQGTVYTLDASEDRIVATDLFDAARTGSSHDWFGLFEGKSGRVWVTLGDRGMAVLGSHSDGGYEAMPHPLGRLRHAMVLHVEAEPDGVVWIAGSEGLIRYDTERNVVRPTGRSVLVRRVVAGPDSLLYDGLGQPGTPRLAYAANGLRFDYALPSFTGPAEYRTTLEGFDEAWSGWGTETNRTYTNLPEGTYIFRVVARDADGVESEEAVYSFSIAPPWWRTVWAYALYAIVLVSVLYSARRYEMNRIHFKHRADLEHAEAESLRALDQTKSRFFTNISHEFRTPLTLILGPVTDAIERREDLPLSQLPIVRRNGERLLRLVNQLLDLARLEDGSMPLQTERADLVVFLRGLVYSFESLAEQEGIDLRFEAAPERITLAFDRDRLEQVFYNLVGNAFKFTPRGGVITVSCTAPSEGDGKGGYAQIEVRDTGTGIATEHLPHVFDRFVQVARTEAGPQEGSGVGLALTKALVERHGGVIVVESTPGVGTTFTVRLPLGADHPAEDAILGAEGRDERTYTGRPDIPPVPPEPKSTKSAVRIGAACGGDSDESAPNGAGVGEGTEAVVLVVEDNDDVRAYVRQHLAGTYCVLEAGDGAEGVALAQEAIPDLIVTDVMMPEVDGYALAKAVRGDERTSHIPIVMLTAKAAESDKLEGLETGVDDYLIKPFSPRELHARVHNLIEQRRLLRERFRTATVIRPAEVTAVSLDQAFLERVVSSVEAHLGDEGFAVPDLAEAVGLSRSQLNRKLGALVGQSAGQLIRSMRLQRGADLLRQRAGTVAEIAYRVGFANPAHFSTSFKKQFGRSPSAFQRGD